MLPEFGIFGIDIDKYYRKSVNFWLIRLIRNGYLTEI